MEIINRLKFHYRILYTEPPIDSNRPEQQQFQRVIGQILKANSLPIQVTGYVYHGSAGSSFSSYPALLNNCEIRAQDSAWTPKLMSTFGLNPPTDQEVAVPISHEIGHCMLFEKAKDHGIWASLVYAWEVGISKNAYETDEINADILGMMILAKAKINPMVVIEYWENRLKNERKLQDQINARFQGVGGVIDSHLTEKRIKQLKEHLGEARAIYNGPSP